MPSDRTTEYMRASNSQETEIVPPKEGHPEKLVLREEGAAMAVDRIVAWLERRSAKWRHTALHGVGDAASAASHWSAAYAAAAQGIREGGPWKRP